MMGASQSKHSSNSSNANANANANANPQLCVVCFQRPAYNKGGKKYPTCGLTCAGRLQAARDGLIAPAQQARIPRNPRPYHQNPFPPASHRQSVQVPPSYNAYPYIPQPQGGPPRITSTYIPHVAASSNAAHQPQYLNPPYATLPLPQAEPCVVCSRLCPGGDNVTCGATCTKTLFLNGGDATKCNYCHKRPRNSPHLQCGQTCMDKAKAACLFCRCRPRNGRYHLCGRTCKQIAVTIAPLLLEALPGHSTYEMVEKKFQASWKATSTCPKIQRIYKIVENAGFLQAYDKYKQLHGNEQFRYHGTSRQCTLGDKGSTTLCNSTTCALCSILRTSFKVSLARTSGAFGPGVYSSSASNKAFSYSAGTGNGVMFLTKVVMGKVHKVSNFGEVSSCPAGSDSVVFDRQNGSLNETIVYTDDAIRPVFLLCF